MKMLKLYCKITIVQCSKGNAAVSYQSAEKLFSEYSQKNEDYRKKDGIAYTEIMLPSHAPPEYAAHETLGNVVEAIERNLLLICQGTYPETGKGQREV